MVFLLLPSPRTVVMPFQDGVTELFGCQKCRNRIAGIFPAHSGYVSFFQAGSIVHAADGGGSQPLACLPARRVRASRSLFSATRITPRARRSTCRVMHPSTNSRRAVG